MVGSGVMTIFFYKALTTNPEIGNTLVQVLPNIWRLRRVRDTKFGTNVFNKILANAMPRNDRVTVLSVSESLRENQQGGKINPSHPD